MMAGINFLLGFFFSFIGSIPPGTINLTCIQLGLEKKMDIAWRFAAVCAILEYPYAWAGVEFAEWITSSPVVIENMQLITAIVMTVLGVLTLWSSTRPTSFTAKLNDSAYVRGVVLSVLNPLAIPFWVGTTAYLNSLGWIDLSTPLRLHSYLVGICVGAFAILMILTYLAQRIVSQMGQNSWLKKIPGLVLILLGIYAFIEYLF